MAYYSNVKDKNKARLVEAIYKQFKKVFLDTMEVSRIRILQLQWCKKPQNYIYC